jgi:hypothetical protein
MLYISGLDQKILKAEFVLFLYILNIQFLNFLPWEVKIKNKKSFI